MKVDVPAVAEPVAFEAFHVPLSMVKSYVVVGVLGVVGVLSGLVGLLGVVGVSLGFVGLFGVTSWLCGVVLIGDELLPPQPELRDAKTRNAIMSQHKFLCMIEILPIFITYSPKQKNSPRNQIPEAVSEFLL